jgi:hypothetical protein
MMKRLITYSALFALAIVGCKQPAEVELTDDVAFENVVVDQLERQSVDSTGLLPTDEASFAGQLLVVSTTTSSSRGVETTAFSRVTFEDRLQPIRILVGRDSVVRGFLGMRVDSVLINDVALDERPRRFTSVAGGTIAGGFEYVRDLRLAYADRRHFRWRVVSRMPIAIASFEATIQSPDRMEVLSPVGGTTISRAEDLDVRWRGRGEIGLIVSAVARDPIISSKIITKPIFASRINKEDGRVRISKKVLRALPVADAYVFTFIRLNRDVKTINRFNGKVLVQAASIHNSIVALR